MIDKKKLMSNLEGLTFDDWRTYHCDSDVQGIAIDALEFLKAQPEQKFFVDSDGKMTPLPIQKHGHWIMPRKFFLETQCSACKETYVGDYRMFNYCPNCGAIMDEEADGL